MDLKEFYEVNEDFKYWVDKASETRHRPKEEILKLKMAEYVAIYYKER